MPSQPSGCIVLLVWQFVWTLPLLLLAVITAPIRLSNFPWYLGFKVASFEMAAVLLALAGYWGMGVILERGHGPRAWVVPTVTNALVVVSGAADSDHPVRFAVLGLILWACVSLGMWQAYRHASGLPLALGHKLALGAVAVLGLVLVVIPTAYGIRDVTAVSSDAMGSAVSKGDILWFSTTQRSRAAAAAGDIVLIEDPRRQDRLLIRRLEAVSGEAPDGYTRGSLPRGTMWVTSDNPDDDYDSDEFGPVTTDNLLGTAVCRISGTTWEWF